MSGFEAKRNNLLNLNKEKLIEFIRAKGLEDFHMRQNCVNRMSRYQEKISMNVSSMKAHLEIHAERKRKADSDQKNYSKEMAALEQKIANKQKEGILL
jgi:hypothetical protein